MGNLVSAVLLLVLFWQRVRSALNLPDLADELKNALLLVFVLLPGRESQVSLAVALELLENATTSDNATLALKHSPFFSLPPLGSQRINLFHVLLSQSEGFS